MKHNIYVSINDILMYAFRLVKWAGGSSLPPDGFAPPDSAQIAAGIPLLQPWIGRRRSSNSPSSREMEPPSQLY